MLAPMMCYLFGWLRLIALLRWWVSTMPFDKKQHTALRWSKMPDTVDWSNLYASKCQLVQIPWSYALNELPSQNGRPKPTLVETIAEGGRRSVLRVDPADTYDFGA